MEKKKNNIVLVPSDFTEVADYAIDHAIGIAKILDYKIVILHVVNKDTKTQLKKDKQNEIDILKRLEQICNELSANKGVKAEPILKEGSIFNVIAKVAEEIGANMIVMGTHGKLGVQHLVGSYALKVITSSSIPFIIVQKKGFVDGYKNIVLPMDSTMESKQKVKYATNIAKTFGAQIHLFSFNNTDEFLRKQTVTNLKQAEAYFASNNIPCSIKFAEEKGDAFAKQVITFSENIKADLIVITTASDQFLSGTIFTSKPEDEKFIFNSNQIPVMCVNTASMDITSFRPY